MYNRRFPSLRTPASGKRLNSYPNHDSNHSRKTECRSGDSPCGRGYREKGRLHNRKRLHGDMGAGTFSITGIAGTYGYTRTTAEDLPMLPEPFRLVERQIRTDRGMVTDIAAGRQLKVIDGVFSECDSIIVATDAGREGELIFRWIYSHLAVPSLSNACGSPRLPMSHPKGDGRPQGRI